MCITVAIRCVFLIYYAAVATDTDRERDLLCNKQYQIMLRFVFTSNRIETTRPSPTQPNRRRNLAATAGPRQHDHLLLEQSSMIAEIPWASRIAVIRIRGYLGIYGLDVGNEAKIRRPRGIIRMLHFLWCMQHNWCCWLLSRRHACEGKP